MVSGVSASSRRARSQATPLPQEQDPVCDLRREIDLVGHEQHRRRTRPVLAHEGLEKLQGGAGDRGRTSARRAARAPPPARVRAREKRAGARRPRGPRRRVRPDPPRRKRASPPTRAHGPRERRPRSLVRGARVPGARDPGSGSEKRGRRSAGRRRSSGPFPAGNSSRADGRPGGARPPWGSRCGRPP